MRCTAARVALLALCAAAEPPVLSRLVVLERTPAGFSVAVAHPSRHLPDIDPGRCADTSQLSRHLSLTPDVHHRYNAIYATSHAGASQECIHMVHGPDPTRARNHHDWVDGDLLAKPWALRLTRREGPRYGGAVVRDEEEAFPLHLPLDVTSFAIEHGNGTREHHLVASARHSRGQSGTLADPVLVDGAGQTAGPLFNDDSNPNSGGPLNVIFVSSGYKSPGGHASAQERFLSNIATGMRFLQFPADYGLPNADIATARYFSTFNVFAVWQESLEDGASKPAEGISVANNLGCHYGYGTSTSPARALQCPKSMVISAADVAPISTTAKNTLVIVLVNDADYGGTGVYREGVVKFGTFYNRAIESSDASVRTRAASLLYHEMNHAFADISDEYTVGITQSSGFNCGPITAAQFPQYGEWGFYLKYRPWLVGQGGKLCEKNCAISQSGVGWEEWKPSKQGTAARGMTHETPLEGCYFDNWYRPGTGTSTKCLMEQLAAPMLCPVCREAASLQLYTIGMRLTYPVCPHPDWTVVYVAQSGPASKATFFANDRLFGDVSTGVGKPEMHAQWSVDGADQGGTQQSYFVLDAATVNGGLSVGVHKVQMIGEDRSSWVLEQHKPTAMRQVVIEWTVRVVASESAIQSQLSAAGTPAANQLGECESRGAFYQFLGPTLGFPQDQDGSYNPYLHYRNCTGTVTAAEQSTYQCTCATRKLCHCLVVNGQDRKCGFAYAARRYEQPVDLGETADAIEDWVFGVGGLCVGGGILVLLVAHCILIHHFGRKPTRVLEDTFTTPIKWARIIMMVSAVIFALLGLGAMATIGVVYNRVGAVAKVGLISLGAFFAVIFLGALTGFGAVYYRSLVLLIANGGYLVLGALATLGVAGYLYTVGYAANDTGSGAQNDIESAWKSSIKDDPSQTCAAQDLFSCSGWDVPCNQFQTPDNCPANCEETNDRYGEPCKLRVLEFVHHYFPIAGSVLMGFWYVLAIGAILNFLLWAAIRRSDQLNAHKMSLMMDGPIQSILNLVQMSKDTDEPHFAERFVQRCSDQFKAFDVDNSGELDKPKFKRFFKQMMGIDDTLHLRKGGGLPFGKPRSVAAFSVGLYAEHDLRGSGEVVSVSEEGVCIKFHNGEQHTYKDAALAKGKVQPGFGPPRAVGAFQAGDRVVHERRGPGKVLSVEGEAVRVRFRREGEGCFSAVELAKGALQPADWEDPRAAVQADSQLAISFEEKLDAVFELLDQDGSGTIDLEEWLEVVWLAAKMGPQPNQLRYERAGRSKAEWERDREAWEERAQEFRQNLMTRNEHLENHAHKRRQKRCAQCRRSLSSAMPLHGVPMEEPDDDDAPELHDCWRLMGSLSASQWDEVVSTFNEMAVQGPDGVRYIQTDQPDSSKGKGFRQWLEDRYGQAISLARVPRGEGFSKAKARELLEELPGELDKNGDRRLDFVDWVGTYYRRSAALDKLDWVRLYTIRQRRAAQTPTASSARGADSSQPPPPPQLRPGRTLASATATETPGGTPTTVPFGDPAHEQRRDPPS